MATIKINGIDRPVMTHWDVGVATLRALAVSMGVDKFYLSKRALLVQRLKAMGVDRFASAVDNAAQQWVYYGLGELLPGGTRPILCQTTLYERFDGRSIADDASEVSRVKLNGDSALAFYRDPRTRHISVEITDERGLKHKGYLCKNVSLGTLAKRIQDALEAANIGE